jgi:hypothetical protein
MTMFHSPLWRGLLGSLAATYAKAKASARTDLARLINTWPSALQAAGYALLFAKP